MGADGLVWESRKTCKFPKGAHEHRSRVKDCIEHTADPEGFHVSVWRDPHHPQWLRDMDSSVYKVWWLVYDNRDRDVMSPMGPAIEGYSWTIEGAKRIAEKALDVLLAVPSPMEETDAEIEAQKRYP